MKSITRLTLATLAVTFALGFAPPMGATEFTLKDRKTVNAITFTLDGRVESMSGSASGIDGKVEFDPDDPSATTGRVVIEAQSLKMTNPTMTGHLHSERWLDVAKFPTIVFKVESVKNVRKEEGKDPRWTMDVTGTLDLHGVKKSITVPVDVTSLPGFLAARQGQQGDLLMLRSRFSLSRADFDIDGKVPLDMVSDRIDLSFSVAAIAPKT